MIYLISDIHGDYNFKGLQDYINNGNDDDLLIILGDTELQFASTDANCAFTRKFLEINKKIAIVDGNHDNFEFLNSFPEEEWNGGVVNRLTENIVRMRRGNVYNIDGNSFFVFGGCKSSPKWKEMGLWYDGEEPSDKELSLAYDNLKRHNFCFDYILTHKYEGADRIGTVSERLLELTGYIEENVKYKKWYYGHWHYGKIVDDKHTVVFDEMIKLGE